MVLASKDANSEAPSIERYNVVALCSTDQIPTVTEVFSQCLDTAEVLYICRSDIKCRGLTGMYVPIYHLHADTCVGSVINHTNMPGLPMPSPQD